MSFENKNLYHLLGNDVEDDEVVPQQAPKEVVKKNTSSKKADVAPASADPAKAKKKVKVTGNEAAAKAKNDNKDVAAPSATPTKHQKKPFDRHSRTGKTDSKKKLKQGWGEGEEREAEGEAEGAEDANAELAAEDAEEDAEPEVAKRSLQDYFAELQVKQQELGGATKSVRKPNEGVEDKWNSEDVIEKHQESFFESTAAKKTKTKAAKEKKFLEVEASFADEVPQQRESFRGGRGNSRGGNTRGGARGGARGGNTRGGARGGARGGKRGDFNGKKEEAKPQFDEQNFPSL